MVQRIIEISQTPVISSATYASGNALGGMLTFSAPSMDAQFSLTKVLIFDKSNQKSAIDLILFNQSFVATADKSAINISLADMANVLCVGSVAAGDYATLGTGAVATHTFTAGGIDLAGADSLSKIYGQLVCRGTPVYASTSDITVKIALEVWRE